MEQNDKKGKENDLRAGDDITFYFPNSGTQLDLKLRISAKYYTFSLSSLAGYGEFK